MARELSFLEQRVADRAAEKREQRESNPDAYAQEVVAPVETRAPVMSAASLQTPKSGAELRGQPVENTGKDLKRVASALTTAVQEAKNREAQRRREADREFSIEQHTSEDTHENLVLLQNVFKEQTNKIVKTLKSQHQEMMKAVGGQSQTGLLGGLFDLFGSRGGAKVPPVPGKPLPGGGPGKIPSPAGPGEVKPPSRISAIKTRVFGAGKSLFESARGAATSVLNGAKSYGARVATALEEQGGTLSKIPSTLRGAAQTGGRALESASNAGSKAVSGVRTALSPAWNSVKSIGTSAIESGKSLFGAMRSGTGEALSKASSFTSRASESVLGSIKGIGAQASRAAEPAIDGLRSITGSGSSVLGSIGRTLSAAIAPVLGAYEAYGVLKDDTKTDGEKAQGVANAAGGVAGSLAGGSAGAAMGTAVLPGYGTAIGGVLGGVAGYFGGEKLVDSIGTSVTSALVDSKFGEVLGKGAALAMAPFSEDARYALKKDWSSNVEEMRAAIQPIADSTTSLKDSMKDYLEGFKSAGLQLGSSVYGAAATIFSGARAAVGNVITTGREKGISAAVSSLPSEASKAWGSASSSAGTELSSGLSAAKQTLADVRTRQTSNTKGIAAGRWNESETSSIRSGEAGGEKFRAGAGLTQDTKDRIAKISEKYGIDPEHLMTMAQMESGGNTNAVSSTGAAGLFQFTGGTAKQYGLRNRFDPDQNIDAAARLYMDNKKSLEGRGIEPTLDNIYLAHQQGAAGASQILNAARTGAPLTDAVKANIGVNVGGNAGSVQGFIDANHRALAAAGKKAQITASPDGATAVAVNSVATGTTIPGGGRGTGAAALEDYRRTQAQASESPAGSVPNTAAKVLAVNSAVSPGIVSQTLPAIPTDLSKYSQQAQAQSPAVQAHSYAAPQPMVSAAAVPQSLVGPQVPVEVPRVRVLDDETPMVASSVVTRSTDTKTRGGSSQPTLDEVPMQISDLGLILLNIGHI